MARLGAVRVLSTLLLLCLTSSVVYAATITGTVLVNANPNPAPPAGKKAVYVQGTYTTMPNEKVDKIESTFFVKDINGKLDPKGTVSDPNFKNNKYTTSEFVADQGTNYTVITNIYVNGNMTPAAGTVSYFTP